VANRWPPWIEARAACGTTKTAFTSTTASALSGATVTIVPKLLTRVQVTGVFDIECTTFVAATNIIGELFVATNGGAAALQVGVAVFGPAIVNQRATVAQHWTLTLAAGSSYVLDLRVRLNAASGNDFSIRSNGSALLVFGMPLEGEAY
jgi:hypothetical protein